jgi:hypothetical protein
VTQRRAAQGTAGVKPPSGARRNRAWAQRSRDIVTPPRPACSASRRRCQYVFPRPTPCQPRCNWHSDSAVAR